MKTIKKDEVIKRYSDERAASLVREEGWKAILWTCRDGVELEQAVRACNEQDLYFDAINDNIDKEENNRLSRKIYASLYIDDKAINMLDI